MEVVYDIKRRIKELHPNLMDATFHLYLLKKLFYTMIRTPQRFSVHFFKLEKEMKYLSLI